MCVCVFFPPNESCHSATVPEHSEQNTVCVVLY